MPDLAGKKADYAVTLNEIKEKVLAGVGRRVRGQALPERRSPIYGTQLSIISSTRRNMKSSAPRNAQIVRFLHEHISSICRRLLKNETRRALNELVHRNRERGVTDEILKGKEKELIEGAGSLAAHRLKTNFILHRIAEREKIQVTPRNSMNASASRRQYNVSVEKMRKELEEHDGLTASRTRSFWARPLIFLKANVSVETLARKRRSAGIEFMT